MAAPSALRLAIEACRPSKSSATQLRPIIQCRRAMSHTSRASKDVAQGSPRPIFSQRRPRAASCPSGKNVKVSPNATYATEANSPNAVPKTEARTTSMLNPSAPAKSEAKSSVTPDVLEAEPLPPNVLAAYRVPMKHKPQYGLPVASLQLRSYSVRNLEFFADFCLRAAFWLKLPSSGPVPLPRKIERWTTLRSNFVHKKSQENFERITHRRLITIMDGHPDVVERWLAFVRKWQFYGVGMKANVWEFSTLAVGEKMDQIYNTQVAGELSEKLKDFGFNKTIAEKTSLDRLIQRSATRGVGVPMSDVRERSMTDEDRAFKQGQDVQTKQ